MSTPTLSPSRPLQRPSQRSLPRQIAGLATRSLRAMLRLPSAAIPALLMPVFQVISFSGTYRGVVDIPGFPTDRAANWYLPLATVMGCSFAGVALGFAAIRDLQTGFYDRIRMSPADRRALLLGPAAASGVRAAIAFVVVQIVGTLVGARLTDGALGLLTLAIAAGGMATVATFWALGLAYRLGDMRAAAIMQLTLFLGLFLTEAQTPLSVMRGWLYHVARFNPLTYVLRLARVGYLGDITWSDSWRGLVALTVMIAASAWFARRGLARLGR